MRLIKMFGLAAVAAVAAMALVGASSASAANTQLCATHTDLTCSSGASSVSMENTGAGVLLNSFMDILCLNIEATATPLTLGNPQTVHILNLAFTECGTNTTHDDCEFEVTELPIVNLNKTGLDAGILTATDGKILLYCGNVLGSAVECEYDATGLTFAVGSQHLTANESPIDEIGFDFLCPNSQSLDGLMQMSGGNRYVLA